VSDSKTFDLWHAADLSSYPLHLPKIQKTKSLAKNRENQVLGRGTHDFAAHFQLNFLIPQGVVDKTKIFFY
jgi:hypothetical protein